MFVAQPGDGWTKAAPKEAPQNLVIKLRPVYNLQKCILSIYFILIHNA
jgi:hypothetical protein